MFFFLIIQLVKRDLYPRCLGNVKKCQPIDLQSSCRLTSFGYVISSTNIVFEFKALITEIEWCNTSDTFTSWSNGTPASRRVGDGTSRVRD